MAPFKLPPPPPPEDPTHPEGAIPTRLDLAEEGESRSAASRTSALTPLEIPLAQRVDTVVAATHRGYLAADRRCEERLEGARAVGWRMGVFWGALGGVIIFIAGILLYKLLPR